ncbi:hypothetical protein ES705_32350 [subsurface metagenome]
MNHSTPVVIKRDTKVESLKRAVRSVFDLIYFGICRDSKLLSLTFKDPCFDREHVAFSIKNMCSRYLRDHHQPLAYLSVLELHPGGHGYHVHMLVNAPYISQAAWQDDLWQQGIVDIRSLGKRGSSYSDSKVAHYLVKYMEKDAANVPPGSRRYNISRAWPKRPPTEYLQFEDYEAAYEWFSQVEHKAVFKCDTFRSILPTGEIVQSLSVAGLLPAVEPVVV